MIEHLNLFIGGEWIRPAGQEVLEVISPSTEEIVGRVPLGTTGDIDRAVAAARRAFDEGPWPRMSVDQRRTVLRRAGELLAQQADELDRVGTSENGVTIRTHQGHAGDRIDYYLGLDVPNLEERNAPNGDSAYVVHEPVGVVGAIIPWNGPVPLSVAKLWPALLAGCTMVLKPAPETPLSAYILAKAFAEAGLPAGVLNVVAADRDVSEALVRHADVDHVSFTGSTATGKRIAGICAGQVKRVFLELGGKSPAVLLDDVDVDIVASQVLNGGMLMSNGQACCAWTRILVPRFLHDEVVDALCAVVQHVTVGDPFDPATVVGPLVSQRQRERVEGYIALGREEGAKVAIGGGRPAHCSRGWYVEPTIFVGADNSMRICREEIFGPVVSVLAYDDEDDAIRIANDTNYGLSAAVFTSDQDRGVALAGRIRSGTVGVNSLGINVAFPFGGFKESGIGRQHGPESLLEYLEVKTIALPARGSRHPQVA